MEIVTGKYTIKQIFKDKWNDYLVKHPNTPDYIRKEVDKMLNCRNPEHGYAKFSCPDHPAESRVVPFSCKSRFCNVCGVNATNQWVNDAATDFPNTQYFHVVFTVPDYLWYFFHYQSNRSLLDLLFKASAATVIGWFETRSLIPGITSVLHTFGKKLNFNTHIHMIVTAAGLGLDQQGQAIWKKITCLPESVLKKRWRAILLTMLSSHIDSSFKSMLFKIGWYVNIGIRLIDPKVTCRYIGRYTKRPVMAESRITDYDGNFITFYYEDKSEGFRKKEYCRLPWEEFITRLIQHIPQPGFRMIRYYGVLSNPVRKKYQTVIFKLLNQVKQISSWLKWRVRQIEFKRIDPLRCKICGQAMILKELAFYSSTLGKLQIKTF